MPASAMLRCVALGRADVTEECIASIIMVTRIGEQISVILVIQAVFSSETSVLIRVTRRNISEDDILHRGHRENLTSYIELTDWAL
jgi:hypothetical protein